MCQGWIAVNNLSRNKSKTAGRLLPRLRKWGCGWLSVQQAALPGYSLVQRVCWYEGQVLCLSASWKSLSACQKVITVHSLQLWAPYFHIISPYPSGLTLFSADEVVSPWQWSCLVHRLPVVCQRRAWLTLCSWWVNGRLVGPRKFCAAPGR